MTLLAPAARSLLFGLALTACHSYSVPGLGPLVGPPPQPLVPENMACGAGSDPEPHRTPRDAAIVGAADFHNHQFSNVGFGGRFLWGQSFHPEGIEHALSACSAPHGLYGATDPVGAVLGQGVGHSNKGFPEFQGWPHYNSYTHQQEYHRWLRRAFDGGLKLIVMLAVSNEVLCEFLGHTHACDDMTNVDLQIREARNLERFIDWQADCNDHNGNGWYRIAESPAEAREIIADGAMAVVLGIEVDTLFNCYKGGTCTPESIRKDVEKYRSFGVSHVFPMHLFDNALGGTAAANDFFNFGSAVVNHELLKVRDCSAEGYAFRFGHTSTTVNRLLSSMADWFGIEYPQYPSGGAHCNTRGLTSLGREAVQSMMNAKMLIDVDHMSVATRAATLDLAAHCAYPGIVSGHSGFGALRRGQTNTESQLRTTELDRILGLGGLVAPMLHQGNREEIVAYKRPQGTRIANDCGGSAKSFAQAYLFAVDATKRARAGPVAVGFGSDINGLAGMPAPRFGPYACSGDGESQSGRVEYPFAPLHGTVGRMDRHQAGHRVFDINVDGFAHMGMFPDFVAELRAIGLGNDDLEPLFGSAEAYIALWEAAWARPDCH